MGASPLVLTDVEAYCRLTGVRLTSWELDTLLAIDLTAIAAANTQKAET